jgi:hypothetical protein
MKGFVLQHPQLTAALVCLQPFYLLVRNGSWRQEGGEMKKVNPLTKTPAAATNHNLMNLLKNILRW